jgi:hypothetical protein
VSQFRSGDEVLQTARLQVDALGGDHGGLVVEGAGDRKLFAPLCFASSQVVIAGGKSLVLEAHRVMREDDIGRFAFVVDCDGDVGARGLKGDRDLIITEHADVEGDLLAMGALELVVEQVVPSVASGEQSGGEVAKAVYSEAVVIAEPVGRVRQAARLRSISLSSLRQQDMDYFAIGASNPAAIQGEALRQVVRAAGLTQYQSQRIAETVARTPSGVDVCNGHDLVEAVQAVLIRDHRISGGKAAVRSVDALLRMTMLDASRREAWSVVARLRRWEAEHGRHLLKP